MEINPMVLTSITTSFLTSLAAKGITGPKEFINNNISSIIDLKEKTDFSMQPHAYVLSPLGIEFKKICIKNSL